MPTTSSMPPRKSIDCRLHPSEKGCTLKISGTEEEVLKAAAAQGVRRLGRNRLGYLWNEPPRRARNAVA